MSKMIVQIRVVGGISALLVNVKRRGWVRGLFRKKRRLPLFGRKGYQCPGRHKIIAVVRWRM